MLLRRHAPDAPVAFGPVGERTAANLVADVAAITAALPAPTPSSAVLLVVDDLYAFAAGLLGIWAAGHRACLPPTNRRHAVLPLLERVEVVELLHDTSVGRGIRLDTLLPGPGISKPIASQPIGAVTGAFEASADGLSDAVARLLQTHPQVEGARSAATLPPLSRHGLVAGLLAPLCGGGAFCREIGAAVGTDVSVLVTVEPHRTEASASGTGLVLSAPCGTAAGRSSAVDRLRSRPDVQDAVWLQAEGLDLIAVQTDADADSLVEDLADLAPAQLLTMRSLPRDPTGEPSERELLLRFGRDGAGHPLAWSLDLSAAEVRTENGRERRTYTCIIPERYGFFEGHFPGYPILAGVVQLHELVVPAVREAWPELGALRKLIRLKFMGPIFPGDTVTLGLTREPDSDVVAFDLRKGDASCSSGRLSHGA